jgi:hypothetical protein
MFIACSASSVIAPPVTKRPDAGVASLADATFDAYVETNSGIADASGGYPVDAYGQCRWPASLDDAGPGACLVGRAYVQCSYPSGVTCDGGEGAFSPEGITQLCISNDPASCSGCNSTEGAATCKSVCAPNEYAMSCGGPPRGSPDGNSSFEYQEAPDGCVGVGFTPGGNGYYCCPCEASSQGGAQSAEGGVGPAESSGPAAQGFVSAYVGPGSANSSACGFGSEVPIVTIGVPTDPEPGTESSGSYQAGASGGIVTIDCSVDPSGSAFKVRVFVEVTGMAGGSMSFEGTVDPTNGTSAISAGFTNASGTFSQSNDCTIMFDYMGNPVPVSGSPIAQGRIWGHLSCPNAMQSGTEETGEDGGTVTRTCDGEADFLFENCQ